jgi:hypothetical protein
VGGESKIKTLIKQTKKNIEDIKQALEAEERILKRLEEADGKQNTS